MDLEFPLFDVTGFDAGEQTAFRSALESARFERFDQEMDSSLEDLVRRWAHLAAPVAEQHLLMEAVLSERRGKIVS